MTARTPSSLQDVLALEGGNVVTRGQLVVLRSRPLATGPLLPLPLRSSQTAREVDELSTTEQARLSLSDALAKAQGAIRHPTVRRVPYFHSLLLECKTFFEAFAEMSVSNCAPKLSGFGFLRVCSVIANRGECVRDSSVWRPRNMHKNCAATRLDATRSVSNLAPLRSSGCGSHLGWNAHGLE